MADNKWYHVQTFDTCSCSYAVKSENGERDDIENKFLDGEMLYLGLNHIEDRQISRIEAAPEGWTPDDENFSAAAPRMLELLKLVAFGDDITEDVSAVRAFLEELGILHG